MPRPEDETAGDPRPLVRSLAERIDEILGPVIPADRPTALLDFPAHQNPGDSAIWLGQEDYLRRRGLDVVYRCDLHTYSRSALAARLGGGTILMSGGGSFGDVWPLHQTFRERVVEDFPHNRIVFLPQSVHYRDDSALRRSQEVLDRHPELALLVRDQGSLDFTTASFRADAKLCPDMAFASGPSGRTSPPSADIVALIRSDAESAEERDFDWGPRVHRLDWIGNRSPLPTSSRTQQGVSELNVLLARGERRFQPLSSRFGPLVARTYGWRARHMMRRAREVLSFGKVLVTDRLHGHILALRCGIPHVLMDNAYGKLSSFHRMWTHESRITRWADGPEEALSVATRMLEGR